MMNIDEEIQKLEEDILIAKIARYKNIKRIIWNTTLFIVVLIMFFYLIKNPVAIEMHTIRY